MGSVKVWDGAAWQIASQQGPAGPPTAPAGGATDNLLVKNSGADYDTRWTPYLNSITIGASAATTGAVRLAGSSGWINSRDSFAANDLPVIGLNFSNNVVVGGAQYGVQLGTSTSTQFGIGVTPVPRSTNWTVTAGYTALKTLDPSTTTLAALARVVGTLVDVLKAHGIILP